MKAVLRSYFVALVAFELTLTSGPGAQAQSVLSESQMIAFEELSSYVSTKSTTFELRIDWTFQKMYRVLSPAPIVDIEAFKQKLYLWSQLAIKHVQDSLRGEPLPPEVNWGRRELAFREILSGLGQGAQYRVELSQGEVLFQHQGVIKNRFECQVLGRFEGGAKTYLAGWAIPDISEMLRPVPVMGCFGQLSRVNRSDALAEARRCAWLMEVEYIVEHSTSSFVYYLGLEPPRSGAETSAFDEDDIRPEVLGQLRDLSFSLQSRSAKRVKDLFRSHSETLRRRVALFPPADPLVERIVETAVSLEEMGQKITTQTLLGRTRDKVRSRQAKEFAARLAKLEETWSS